MLSIAAFTTKEKTNSKVNITRHGNCQFLCQRRESSEELVSELLGTNPYFERPNSDKPGSVEFRLGDYEHGLGIIDANHASKGATADPGAAGIF